MSAINTTDHNPVLVVEREPSYMDRGHFYKGVKPYINPTKVWNLPIGTKLYAAPQAARQPLTVNQIKDEASYHGFIGNTDQLVKFVRAIETAHGITGETNDNA